MDLLAHSAWWLAVVFSWNAFARARYNTWAGRVDAELARDPSDLDHVDWLLLKSGRYCTGGSMTQLGWGVLLISWIGLWWLSSSR